MRKFFTTILIISAPLALAACNKPAAEPEETVMTEEPVPVEPATDAMAPATDTMAPATEAAAPPADERGDPTERGDSTERGDPTERGTTEK